jgi:sugar lactone lactonase YvrE
MSIGILASRRAGRLLALSLTLAGAPVAVAPTAAQAAPSEVALPGERAFPESVTATRDGTLFVSSMAEGGVFRAGPGAATAERWIEPGAGDSRSTFGVLADEGSGTLWVCSVDLSFIGVPGPGTAKGSALKAFDLGTGRLKASTPLPGEPSVCNDIAIGPDGSAYVTNTFQPHILRLRPGDGTFEVWATDGRLGPPANGAGLDGIAIGGDGHVYVNTFSEGRLFRVEVRDDGTAGGITELKPSRPLRFPDVMRPHGPDGFLMTEGGGTLDLVTIKGDEAVIETLKDGFAGGAAAVTRVGDTAWVAEGQHPLLLDPKLKDQKPRLPFRLYAVPLAPR